MKSVKKVLAKVQDFAASLKQVYINCKKVVTEIGKLFRFAEINAIILYALDVIK